MTLRERGSGVKRARDPSDIRGGKALAPAVDVDFSPALRAAVRRAGARGRTEDAQELAVLADGVDGNFHYCGLSGASRSLNLSLSPRERCKSVGVGEHASRIRTGSRTRTSTITCSGRRSRTHRPSRSTTSASAGCALIARATPGRVQVTLRRAGGKDCSGSGTSVLGRPQRRQVSASSRGCSHPQSLARAG
jgi:hypothetical protein